MGGIFIGPLRHWLLLAAILLLLWVMGANQFHITHFKLFLAALFGLSVLTLLVILLTYRRGERITRDPPDDEDPS